MLLAMDLFEKDNSRDQVEVALKDAGASAREAADVAGQARSRFESEVLRNTSLPKSAHYDVNYYFLLGVTPTASVERIRRSYRRKAREYHPDRHEKEFSREFWVQLMVMVSDANEVLADPSKRRAYDLVWRERSEKVAAENRRNGNDQGDWETQKRLQMAELSELEDDIAAQVDSIKAATGTGAPIDSAISALAESLEKYESDILGIRNETHRSSPQIPAVRGHGAVRDAAQGAPGVRPQGPRRLAAPGPDHRGPERDGVPDLGGREGDAGGSRRPEPVRYFGPALTLLASKGWRGR